MSALLVLALAAGTVGPPTPVSGRIDGIALVTYGGRLAVRINYTGRPGAVSLTRTGNRARVSMAQTDLGWRFGSGRRFEWRPAAAPVRGFASTTQSIEILQVVQSVGETSLSLELPPDIGVELKQVKYALLVVLREAGTPGSLVAQAPAPSAPMPSSTLAAAAPQVESAPLANSSPTADAATAAPAPSPVAPPASASVPTLELAPSPEPAPAAETPSAPVVAATPAPTSVPRPAPVLAPPAPPVPEPTVNPAPVAAAPVATASVAAPASTPESSPAFASPSPAASDLYRQLFPPSASPADGTIQSGDDTAALYTRLFPTTSPEPKETPVEETVVLEKAPEREEGLPAGPFRLRPTFTLSFVSADASLLETPGTVNDQYFQFEPGIVARAPVGDGAFTAEYAPSFRAGASFSATSDPTHVVSGTLDFPFGSDSRLQVSDRFVSSTLDAREVDPGGEYFFNLSPFHRNLASANARVGVSPRFYVELGAALNNVTFAETGGGFFPYESRLGSVGLGYEISPTLRATASYSYDQVPTPDERPEAESTANSALVSLQGDLLPLLTGQITLGYRDQSSPNAGGTGQHFQGFTMAGNLTRQFSRSSSLSLLLNRSTPVSNFENNGFYVNTSIQGAVSAGLPWQMNADAGLGYSWNDYDLPTVELGVPREDRILGLYAGLRRYIGQRWWVSAFYRREQRRSNLDDFDTTSDGFLVQVNWGLFGPRR